MTHDDTTPGEHHLVDGSDQASARPQVAFDWREWLPYLAEVDATEEQKRELIEALWSIVLAFVDLGWDVTAKPSQTCGQVLDLNALIAEFVVDSQKTCNQKDKP